MKGALVSTAALFKSQALECFSSFTGFQKVNRIMFWGSC